MDTNVQNVKQINSGPVRKYGPTAPVELQPNTVAAERNLGCLLNDLLELCKQVNGTIDDLNVKFAPVCVPASTAPIGVEPVMPYACSPANELVISIERELSQIKQRLQKLIKASTV